MAWEKILRIFFFLFFIIPLLLAKVWEKIIKSTISFFIFLLYWKRRHYFLFFIPFLYWQRRGKNYYKYYLYFFSPLFYFLSFSFSRIFIAFSSHFHFFSFSSPFLPVYERKTREEEASDNTEEKPISSDLRRYKRLNYIHECAGKHVAY